MHLRPSSHLLRFPLKAGLRLDLLRNIAEREPASKAIALPSQCIFPTRLVQGAFPPAAVIPNLTKMKKEVLAERKALLAKRKERSLVQDEKG